MIYGVYDYYTSWSSPLVNGYKCKGVKNAKTGIWSFKGGANHRERYPGCTFCPGMIHRAIQVDGKVVWKLKSEHECTPLSIVDLEAENPVAEVPAVVSDSVAVSAVAARLIQLQNCPVRVQLREEQRLRLSLLEGRALRTRC